MDVLEKAAVQFRELAGVEKVEGEGGDEVEEEPAAEVLLGDAPRVLHNLTLLVHERRPEVQDDVDDEDGLDDDVEDDGGLLNLVFLPTAAGNRVVGIAGDVGCL